MSIYGKPVSQIAPDDLAELLTQSAVENIRLEFKRESPKKDEILKKLSSFANTHGGLLVVGAAGGNDGKLTAVAGVDVLPSYKQTIVQWCFDGLSPPLEIEVSEPVAVPANDGKVCYVISVRESDIGPHFVNGRKGIWVRSDEFSTRFDAQLANEGELRQLLQRRQAVREQRQHLVQRARNRFASWTQQGYEVVRKRNPSGIGARFDLSVGPRFPALPLVEHDRLITLSKDTRFRWRGEMFPRHGAQLVSQHESALLLQPGESFSMLEINRWGMLFYALEIEDETDNYKGIHLYHFLGHVLIFLEHARLILSELGYVGPLVVQMRFDGLRGKPWYYSNFREMRKTGGSTFDNIVSFALDSSTDALNQHRDDIAREIARLTFFATNWDDVTSVDLGRELSVAYQYNSWTEAKK